MLLSEYIIFTLIVTSSASIIDNRTTNDTDTQLIRALRQFPLKKDVMEYNVAPYHPDYYGQKINPNTQPRAANLPPLRQMEKCKVEPCDGIFSGEALYPFILASVFIVFAVLAYVCLFCFVFRFLV